MKPKLDKWLIYGNCLVGYLYDSGAFPHGTRIKTDVILEVDVINSEAVCADGRYKLMEPGTEFDHKGDLRTGEVVGSMRIDDFSKSKPVESKPIIII